MGVKHIFLLLFVLFVITLVTKNGGKRNVTGKLTEVAFDGFIGWTKNPSLDKNMGSWSLRTFCWTVGGDCQDDLLLSKTEWVDDGNIFLKAEDDNTRDLGCNCAVMSQGTDFDGSIFGNPLTRIRTGDVEAAYILLKRSDFIAKPCSVVGGAGNVINLWLKHPDGYIWVTDIYFETEGLNSGFDERPGPHNLLITLKKWVDWYAYQIDIKSHPEYWNKTTYPDGSEYWIIDLKALLDRGSAYSRRGLDDYLWYYVEMVSEDFCFGGAVGESTSRQRIHYFEIKVKLRE